MTLYEVREKVKAQLADSHRMLEDETDTQFRSYWRRDIDYYETILHWLPKEKGEE